MHAYDGKDQETCEAQQFISNGKETNYEKLKNRRTIHSHVPSHTLVIQIS